ncbi:MAG: glutamate--tRNA ligase, partial [Oligoflexus sp.]|nr:glutamate--tRNA ligase [Pseudopedobacter sp.]
MKDQIRVRFAPSPTGGLHIGGVRTILFNYLFAKQNNGKFILRIEDTDQARFVEGAEDYIFSCLEWCGIKADESPRDGGEYGPYRQSERKSIYREYAEKLVKAGYAYYAFDTSEDLESKRQVTENFRYDCNSRSTLRNSLTIPHEAAESLVKGGAPHVIRIKMPKDENISFTDMIRGDITFHSSEVDDKVLLKADGMPTYHLAVVVDDYLMKITHAFRGEEWLPSAPVHLLLWKYFGWENEMPQWAHMPLILKPDGHGKLSKRDGEKFGFPVYPINWYDGNRDLSSDGFKEKGFIPEGFINMLAMLGWNDGTDQELFSMEQLIEKFSLDRIHKAGAKFDYDKAKWYNGEWIKKADSAELLQPVKAIMNYHGIYDFEDAYLAKVIDMVKERCQLLSEFHHQGAFFFNTPEKYDTNSVVPKWTEEKKMFFMAFAENLLNGNLNKSVEIEDRFKELAAEKKLKIGDVMLPFRIMLVGDKFGPAVFDIAATIGAEE